MQWAVELPRMVVVGCGTLTVRRRLPPVFPWAEQYTTPSGFLSAWARRGSSATRAPLRQAQGRLSPATVAPASCRRPASCRGALAPKHLESSSSAARRIHQFANRTGPFFSCLFGGK